MMHHVSKIEMLLRKYDDMHGALWRCGDGGNGAAGGDRTHDPWLRRPILYPLSYSRWGKQEVSRRIQSFCNGVYGDCPGAAKSYQNTIFATIIGARWSLQNCM